MSTPQTRTRGKKTPINPDQEIADTDTTQEVPAVDPDVPKYRLFDKDGKVLFTSNVPEKQDAYYRSDRDKHFTEHFPEILRRALEADVDPAQIVIEGHNFNEVVLAHFHLDGITFESCSFIRADLRHISLRNANLEDCVFTNARMHGADLSGANVDGVSFDEVEARHIGGIIMLGELDTWIVTAHRASTGELRIKAGCRNFTLPEAKEHWDSDRTDRAEIRAALPFLEAIALNRGWRIDDPENSEVVAGDGPGESDEEESEDEDDE